jgi:hypothetical protein
MHLPVIAITPRPRKGDRLFRSDLPDSKNLACSTYFLDSGQTAYKEGYRQAAQLLVQHVVKTGESRDFLVYPIVFLYRHHIELALKRVIRRYPELLDRELTPNEQTHLGGHRLDFLWQDLKPMFTAISEAVAWNEQDPDDIEGADDYFRQLSVLDRDSFSFRYPHSKTGERSLPEDLKIDIGHFAETIERLLQYIDDIDTATSVVEVMGMDKAIEGDYGDDFGC